MAPPRQHPPHPLHRLPTGTNHRPCSLRSSLALSCSFTSSAHTSACECGCTPSSVLDGCHGPPLRTMAKEEEPIRRTTAPPFCCTRAESSTSTATKEGRYLRSSSLKQARSVPCVCDVSVGCCLVPVASEQRDPHPSSLPFLYFVFRFIFPSPSRPLT